MAKNLKASAAAKPSATARPRATRTVPSGQVELVDPVAGARLLVTLIGNYIHRIEVERRSMYFGDLDLARVAEVIALGSVEPGMRDAAFQEHYRSFSRAVTVEEQRPANASSIASATGYPRETVRRKLRQLLDRGFIVEKSRAHYVINPGVYQTPEIQGSIARGFQDTVRFINEALTLGLIRWVPAARGAGDKKQKGRLG